MNTAFRQFISQSLIRQPFNCRPFGCRQFVLPLIISQLVLCLHTFSLPAGAVSLKEMRAAAAPGSGYDRYIELETGVTYTGGLLIGGTFNRITAQFEPGGEDVRIVGNGAILDLGGEEICISYCNNRLDIDDCVILHGNIRYRGYQDATIEYYPAGFVRQVTFYEPHDYGVRLFSCGQGIELSHNIVVDTVDTGPDFMYLSGVPSDWLPTGGSFALSILPPWPGAPEVSDNWSWHSDPAANADLLRHFSLLCDYG